MALQKRQRKSVTEESDKALETSNMFTQDTEIEKGVERVFGPPKKRRKYTKIKVANQRSKRTGIDVKESVSLSGMCEDVLVEIFLQLTPHDLLHLSWTSKQLHNILTTRSLAWVWERARTENILEGIPECPSDLKEPQYANYMFGRHCFYCQKEPDDIEVKTVWSGRTRACVGCIKNNTLFVFESKGKCDWFRSGIPRDLYISHLPRVSMPFGRNNSRNYIHLETQRLWKKEYLRTIYEMKPPDTVQWEKTKMKEREIINNHAHECEIWMQKWNKFMTNERKKMVLNRLKELGWEMELGKITQSCDRPLETETVNKACAGRLTETDLVKLEPSLNEFMDGVRARRHLRDHNIILRKRIPILVEVIDSCKLALPPNIPTPGVGDVFSLPLVLDIINAEPDLNFTEEHLYPLRDAYPEIARQWKLDKEAELIDIIKSTCESYNFDPNTVLDLATTMFSCGRCTNIGMFKPLWHPRILIHRELTSCRALEDPNVHPDITTMHNVTGAAHWNAINCVGFMKDEMIILSNVLAQFGFDPKVVTAAEMNAADPIFECVSCNSPRKGRFTMKWTYLTCHMYRVHPAEKSSSDKCKLEMLQGQEAQTMRERFAEDSALDRVRTWLEKSTICVHCRETNDIVNVADHIWEAHNIDNPTDADMVPNLDVPFLDFRYSWPPRKIQRQDEAKRGF